MRSPRRNWGIAHDKLRHTDLALDSYETLDLASTFWIRFVAALRLAWQK
jgi:hypothetical protein